MGGCNSSSSNAANQVPSDTDGASFDAAILALREGGYTDFATDNGQELVVGNSDDGDDRQVFSRGAHDLTGRSNDFSPWLIVFDFDLTIARYHLWGTYQDKPLDQVPVRDNTFVDLGAFRDFVHAVRDKGHHVAIASFGRKDVVNKAITHALGEEHGIVISTPGDHGHRDGSSNLGSKNTQLSSLVERFNVKLSQIIFLDDDNQNVKEARKIGVDAIHTPAGITKAVLAKVAISLTRQRTSTDF